MSFPDKLQLENVSKNKVRLLTSFRYDSKRIKLTIPAGFETDLASIYMVKYVSPTMYAILSGYGDRAAVVHDYLYHKQGYFNPFSEEPEFIPVSRAFADRVFYDALRADGVARWRAALFYIGVRIGGFSAWRQ